MGGVFINYRTGDGDFAATLIARVLMERFGAEHVFLASKSIRPGEDFAETILERLTRCDVMLAIVGPRWHAVTDQRGRRRINDPRDWVYREIAAAFHYGLRVIPVFLDHTAKLSETELPPEIAALARCQFLRLSHRNDTRDLARMLDELADLVPDLVLVRVLRTPPRPSRDLVPSAWLRAEYEIVPFTGRRTERADLTAWANSSKPVSAGLISGPTGQGKTRLAQQVCQELAERGWVAGFVHDQAASADLATASRIHGPLLFVIDDAEARYEQVHTLAGALMERPATASPARLLLLNQGTGEWLRRLRTASDDRVASLFRTLVVHPLAPLAPSAADRHIEFHRALDAFAEYLHLSTAGLTAPQDLVQPRYAGVRVIHAAALTALLHKNSGGPDQHGASVPPPDPELHRAAQPECPYRGLQPFQEQDARFFRGRDPQVKQLKSLIEHHSMVMVIGASGSGKSSLIRAGLLPALRQQNVTVAVFRPTPGIEPFELLTHALRPTVGAERTSRLAAKDVALLADPIVDAVGRLVLFIDQFEELVATDPAAARELLGLVATLVRAAPPRPAEAPALRAVCTGRWADLDEILTSDLAALLQTVAVPRMGPTELRSAIIGPEDLPLVSFEPGLVDRIVTDAADAPGQLPLVEFALTRLWEARQGATLTHQAYDEQGGVAGALATYAQEVCDRRLLPDERKLVEPLLVQLARPSEDGGFALTPAQLDQLNPALRALAGTLATHRLVVIRQDPGYPEVVALAHEALIHQWPRLRAWLAAAQDFRSWQEQLRVALAQWRQSNRDPTTLLRGAPLATAEDWLDKKSTALTDEERDYIAASRAHQRRGVRRWRLITALIGVLALVAAASAAIAVSRNEELADQLRRAAAVALAQEAQRRSETDPLMALQFAQAAWRHDTSRPEAYAALLQQYLRYADVEEIRTGLWSGPVAEVASTEDGRVTAVAEEDGTITLWTDLFGPTPQRWFVATVPNLSLLRLSPDGRWLAVITDRGGITLWDVDTRNGPLPLRTARSTTLRSPDVRSARFSPDGKVFVVTLRQDASGTSGVRPQLVEVWDTLQRRQIPYSGAAAATESASVLRVEPDGKNAWFDEQSRDENRRTVLRDLTTGAILREVSADLVTAAGFFVECQDNQKADRMLVRDPAGVTLFTKPTRRCPPGPSAGMDVSGGFAILREDATDLSLQQLSLIDMRSGQTYSLRTPPSRKNQGSTTKLIVLRAGSGPPTAYMIHPDALLRFRSPTPTDDLDQFDFSADSEATAVSPDGQLLVTSPHTSSDRLQLLAFDLRTHRLIHGEPVTVADTAGMGEAPHLAFSKDGRRLLAVGDFGGLVVIPATDLTAKRMIPLDVEIPLEPQPPPRTSDGHPRRTFERNLSIIPVTADEVAILRSGGFTRRRISTGEELPPVNLFRSPQERHDSEYRATAIPWPDHPHEVLLTSTNGVELWDMKLARLVHAFQARPGNMAPTVLVDPTAPRVAVHDKVAGKLDLWRLEHEDGRPRPIPVPSGLSPVAFVPDNKLVAGSGTASLRIWDLDTGGEITSLRVSGAPGSWSVHDERLLAPSRNGLLSIDMVPEHWIEHLCRINDRDHAPHERAALPTGADTSAPCQVSDQTGSFFSHT
ncbi:hypothetical protein GCM10012275_09010 [Longimycelium tulufanense]|uniref:TIR domain-containing protein n=1 Tax=Longimycelium tulufanense TaxID=907463 RepID=A0A8J3C9N9_9PSEU|nr:AAA family ATPase [Longimycelium tulufanense]GGM40217.1 hypothetical protein GCM10012275_09010 [Longimycelium tulufanense]